MPAVTRALAALEDRAGLRLVERTTQSAGADRGRAAPGRHGPARAGRLRRRCARKTGAPLRQAARDGAARVRAAPRDAKPSSPSWTSIRTCRSNWCSTTAISI
ncbi:LysR family transcriptional regulator [Massilia sp. H-1]|nr:LysR family transcriptional regulator [Massilia sp. H-1]